MADPSVRDHFLTQVWLPYPSCDQDMERFLCGRVDAVEPTSLCIRNREGHTTVETREVRLIEDEVWGVSAPVEAFVVGDHVAFDRNSGGLFLLAPNLNNSFHRFNPEPEEWSRFLQKVERFFEEQGFLHLHTPYLVVCPGVDHHIDFLRVEAVGTKQTWTLPTSPEIHLKKYLCQGYERIYEIKKCFRDDLPGPDHSIEFTMLEWYRAYEGLGALKDDLNNLIHYLVPDAPPLKVTTVAAAFGKSIGASLTPRTSLADLRLWAAEQSIEVADDDDWNDVFFRIFMECIEPNLGAEGPLLVTHFPPQQASLSQIDAEGWSSRFELYWRGVELANAFLEVNSPAENRERFRLEQVMRHRKGAPAAPLDEEFFDCVESGMPPAAGIALGLDRLFKICRDH